MKEDLILALIKELFSVNELHQEYSNNNIQYVIDSLKKGNTLNIKVELIENKDKEEFESWIKNLDDEIFDAVWEELSNEDNLHSLDELYQSKDYKIVIDKFKAKAKEVINNKIKDLQKLLS